MSAFCGTSAVRRGVLSIGIFMLTPSYCHRSSSVFRWADLESRVNYFARAGPFLTSPGSGGGADRHPDQPPPGHRYERSCARGSESGDRWGSGKPCRGPHRVRRGLGGPRGALLVPIGPRNTVGLTESRPPSNGYQTSPQM